MDFFDGNGAPFDPSKHAKRKRPQKTKVEKNLGWVITGHTKSEVEAARVAHDKENVERVKNDLAPHPPFNADLWAKMHKGKKLNPKNYELEEAARQFAEIATKTGYVGVKCDREIKMRGVVQ